MSFLEVLFAPFQICLFLFHTDLFFIILSFETINSSVILSLPIPHSLSSSILSSSREADLPKFRSVDSSSVWLIFLLFWQFCIVSLNQSGMTYFCGTSLCHGLQISPPRSGYIYIFSVNVFRGSPDWQKFVH